MNSKQFAWLYLFENGLIGVQKSYYGGYDPLIEDWNERFGDIYNMTSYERAKEFAFTQIKEWGIDWKKTLPPKSDIIYEFAGTFAESKETEFLSGTLILKNGEKQQWLAESLAVTNVFDMMAQIHKAEARYYQITGEGE